MRKHSASQSGVFNPRVLVAFMLCAAGAFLAMFSFAANPPSGKAGLDANSSRDSLFLKQRAGQLSGNATATAAAQPGIAYEIEIDGRSVRSVPLGVTPSENAPSESVQATQGDGRILWIDRNHQNAIAQHVAITGDGRYVIAGWWLNNGRASLYDTFGAGVPLWSFPIASSFFTPVDASFDGSVVTATGRNDNLYRWSAPASVPVCVKSHPIGEQGVFAITPNVGGQFAGCSFTSVPAVGVPVTATTHAHGIDCSDRFSVPTLSAYPVWGRYAAAGAWVGITTRDAVFIYDSQSGQTRGTVPVLVQGGTEATTGISGDGGIIAIGGYEHILYVYQWNGSAYAQLWSHNIPSTTWITAIDVSDDGSTVAVGTFLASGGGSVLLYEVAAGPTPLWRNNDFGSLVDDVDLTPDGSRAIAGSWGKASGTFGHLVAAFDRASSVPIFAVEDDALAGVASCHSVRISNNGRWAAASGKAAHAQEFGNGGYVIALDLEGSPILVQSVSVVSRKVHGSAGTFDLDLPLTGPGGVECRSGGANGDYVITFTFVNTLTGVGGASVTTGTGSVSSSALDGSDAHQYIVNLTGVTNAQVITVSLTNVNDSAGNSSSLLSASMGVLLGDTTANRAVSNTDVAEVKGQVSAPVTASNFRNDVNANGVVSNTDVSATKAQVSTTLP